MNMPSTNPAKLLQDPEKLAQAATFSNISSSSFKSHRPASEVLGQKRKFKMTRLHHVFLGGLLLLIFGFTIASTTAKNAVKAVSVEEKIRFHELLQTVEAAALHEVLHEQLKDKYQHGVYEEDTKALEVLHRANAKQAQSLIELAKRQSSNTTTSAVVAPPKTTTTTTAVVVPPTTLTTPQQTATQVPATTTTVQTTQPGVATTTTKTTDATVMIPATTPGAGTTLTTGPSSVQNAPTNAPSTISSATRASSVTQQVVYTTTQGNGALTTVTSVTVVPANQAMTAGGVSTKTNGGSSLQTNAAQPRAAIGMGGIFGALGVVAIGVL